MTRSFYSIVDRGSDTGSHLVEYLGDVHVGDKIYMLCELCVPWQRQDEETPVTQIVVGPRYTGKSISDIKRGCGEGVNTAYVKPGHLAKPGQALRLADVVFALAGDMWQGRKQAESNPKRNTGNEQEAHRDP